MPPHAHLAIKTLALHLLLERAQRLIDIVVANLNLDDDRSPVFRSPVSPLTEVEQRDDNRGSLWRGLTELLRQKRVCGKSRMRHFG